MFFIWSSIIYYLIIIISFIAGNAPHIIGFKVYNLDFISSWLFDKSPHRGELTELLSRIKILWEDVEVENRVGPSATVPRETLPSQTPSYVPRKGRPVPEERFPFLCSTKELWWWPSLVSHYMDLRLLYVNKCALTRS